MSGPLLVLVGPPASGKTTVGTAVAAAVGAAFRDTDRDIEMTAGATVGDVFVEHGEEHFRALEARAVAVALAEHDGVLALGGGSVTGAPTRELLVGYGRAGGTVVWLDVDLRSAAKRVGLSRDRPILGINPRAMLRTHARAARTAVRRGGHVHRRHQRPDPRRGGRRGPRRRGPANGGHVRRIAVPGPAPYEVVIGPGAQAELALVLDGAARAAVVHAAPLAAAAGAAVETLQTAGIAAEAVVVPDGEAAKTAEVAAGAWEEFGRLGLTRSDAVVGIGGGAVTDLAGFLAATWTRGVRVVQVPTSLLGMVDAAVGGKTGINTAAGKNLVGAFHPPAAVLADTDALAGLPDTEFRSGLAEVVKCGFIADGAILDLLDADPTGRRDTEELVARAVQVKADAVGEDLYDLGRREFLNYGHTLAHAIERVEDFGWRHGEAVAVGLVFAAELAGQAALLSRAEVDRHRSLIEAHAACPPAMPATGPSCRR